MAPQLTDDEVDDLLYLARTGELEELKEILTSLSDREKTSSAEILSSARDQGRSTCLHMATGNGHLEIIKYLLDQFTSRPKEEKQAFLDAPNEYGNTGLHWAAMGGHLEVVKLLMANGASPALANDKNYVPLDLAGLGDHFKVVDYFLAESKGLESDNGAEGLGEAVGDVEIEDDGEPASADEEKGEGSAKAGASS